MNRCNPHPLPEGEGIDHNILSIFKEHIDPPLPLGEGRGEGYTDSFYNQLIRISLRHSPYKPLFDKSVRDDNLEPFTNVFCNDYFHVANHLTY